METTNGEAAAGTAMDGQASFRGLWAAMARTVAALDTSELRLAKSNASLLQDAALLGRAEAALRAALSAPRSGRGP